MASLKKASTCEQSGVNREITFEKLKFNSLGTLSMWFLRFFKGWKLGNFILNVHIHHILCQNA
jgi:hypothetical protein